MGAQAGNDVVDAVDGEHDATDAERGGRRVLRLGASSTTMPTWSIRRIAMSRP